MNTIYSHTRVVLQISYCITSFLSKSYCLVAGDNKSTKRVIKLKFVETTVFYRFNSTVQTDIACAWIAEKVDWRYLSPYSFLYLSPIQFELYV